MRDIYADIPGYGKHKINSAYALGGPELLRKTLDKNLGINPEYYAVVDFTGFEKMIDELMPEGVPINVEKICRKILVYLWKRVTIGWMVKNYLVMQDSVTTLKVTSDACDVSNKWCKHWKRNG